MLITSSHRWALMHELRGSPEPSLEEQLKHFSACDVVIVEGWKHHAMPKIEVHRKLADRPLLFIDDPSVVAVATDECLATTLPQFGLDDAEGAEIGGVKGVGIGGAHFAGAVAADDAFAETDDDFGDEREPSGAMAGDSKGMD